MVLAGKDGVARRTRRATPPVGDSRAVSSNGNRELRRSRHRVKGESRSRGLFPGLCLPRQRRQLWPYIAVAVAVVCFSVVWLALNQSRGQVANSSTPHTEGVRRKQIRRENVKHPSDSRMQLEKPTQREHVATVVNREASGSFQELEHPKKRASDGVIANSNKPRNNPRRQRQRIWPLEANLESLGMKNGVKALKRGKRKRRHLPEIDWFKKKTSQPDYGDLEIRLLHEGQRREIFSDPRDTVEVHVYRTYNINTFPWQDEFEQYDPMDDDIARSNMLTAYNDNEECRKPSWFDLQFPTCNSLHEMRMIHANANNRFLGRGFFRMVFAIQEKNQPDAVLKVARWMKSDTSTFSVPRFGKTRMDALVMERLTSSPRITDIYGHCAYSILSESLPIEVWDDAVPTGQTISPEDLDDRDDVDPKNTYTPTEKISMALELAEALADLHGFKDGMIVHDDIDLGQYLRKTQGGRLKLNDFNRAKPLLWDESKQEYCKYYNGDIGGKVRAPEEFVPTILDEKIDIFSLGNCFYGLLTGLYPHYLEDKEEAQKKLMDGEMPFIDDRYRKRSYAEKKLVEAIEMCYHHNPEKRSDVFAIVKHLRAAVDENNAQKKSSR